MTATDLRIFRARLRLKQSDVAAMLGVARSYVSMMESGERPIPERIAKRVEALSKLNKEASK